MPPVTIPRTAWIDDDGSGTTGTVINNAEKTQLYNQIDTALALVAPAADIVTKPSQVTGVWTPTATAGVTLTTDDTTWVKIGQLVLITAHVVFPTTSDANLATLTGLPFVPSTTSCGGSPAFTDIGITVSMFIHSNGFIYIHNLTTGAGLVNSQMSGKQMRFGLIYRTAS